MFKVTFHPHDKHVYTHTSFANKQLKYPTTFWLCSTKLLHHAGNNQYNTGYKNNLLFTIL